MTRRSTCHLLLCRRLPISYKTRDPKKRRTSIAADGFASYTRCYDDSFLANVRSKQKVHDKASPLEGVMEA